MSDNDKFEFELPYSSPVMPVRLELNDELNFRCHRGACLIMQQEETRKAALGGGHDSRSPGFLK